MLYPLLRKRILSKIKHKYEDIILTKESIRQYPEYSKWIASYLDLTDEDKENILTKFERSQASTIVFGMRKQDREIFVNNIGVFYIKQTTIDYYRTRAIIEKDNPDMDSKTLLNTALEQCREIYKQRQKHKENAKNVFYIKPKE